MSSRFRDDDAPEAPRRRKRRRKKRSFPVGWLIALLILLPLIGIGGFLIYTLIHESAGSSGTTEEWTERGKKKLLGEWTFLDKDKGYFVNLHITEGHLDIVAARQGKVAKESLSWTVESANERALTLRLKSTRPTEPEVVWEFEFLPNGQARFRSKSNPNLPPRIYTKKGGGDGPALALEGNAKRLVGKWEARITEGGVQGRVVFEYGANGSASTTVSRSSGEALTAAGRWQVLSDSGDTIRVRVSAQNAAEERTMRFVSNDEYLLTSPGKPSVKFRRVR